MKLPRILLVGDTEGRIEADQNFHKQMMKLEAELSVKAIQSVNKQFLDDISSFLPDVILYIYGEDELPVLKAVREIANHFPSLPVMVLNGPEDTELAVNCLKAGATDYISIEKRSDVINRLKTLMHLGASNKDDGVGEQLFNRPEFFAHILGQHPLETAVFDLEGRYLFVNATAISEPKIRRWIVGKTDLDYYKKLDLPEENASKRLNAIRTCIQKKDAISLIEKFPSKNGLRWIMRNFSPFLDSRNNVQYVISYSTDLTEQRQTEALLRQSEEKYRILYDANPTMYFTMDKEGIVISVNQYGANHLGYSQKELIGDSVLKIFHEPDVKGVKKQFQKCLENPGETFQWEFRKVQKDGKLMWVEEFARAVKGPDGEIIVLVVCEDINERKKAEAELEEKERQYRNIFEAVTDGLLISGPDEIIVEANPAACEMYGYDYEELIGLHQSQLLHPDYIQAFEDAISRLKTDDHFFCETIDVRKDSSAFPVEVHGSCIMYKGKTHMLTVVRDISERKLIEENIKKNEKMLKASQAMAHMGSFEWDIQKNKVLWSDELYRIYGLEPGAFGASFEAFLEYIHPSDRENVRAKIEHCLVTHEPFQMEERVVRADNEMRILATKGELILHKETKRPVRLVGVCQDITDRVRAEEKRRELEQQIQHTQKLESLGVLAGGIAHDFNNILTGILGNAGLALMELSARSAIYTNVENVEKASRRAAELCRQLLAYSGKGDFVIGPLNLNNVVKELTQLFDVSIARKAALNYELYEKLPPIKGDVAQIHQVVMNLITNAADAIEGTHGTITIRTGLMKCDAEYLSDTYLDDNLPGGEYVFVEVADTGIGMDRKTLQKIFDPFFSTKFTGRGLGLAALLGIVRSHKGAINVSSELGKGTIFRVLFPKSDSLESHQTKVDNKYLSWKGSGTILVVDDEEIVREIGKKSLEAAGFNVLTAIDGLEAVEIYREQGENILLVLLDMTMPYMNGEETYQHLRQIRKDIKVIFSSGFRENEAKMHLKNNENTDFIPKPYHPMQLIEKVRRVLLNIHEAP